MKHISWAVPLLFVATTAMAQPAGVSVSLAANPANQSDVGIPVVLTATVRTPGVGVMVPGGGGTLYERDRMRFTFKAQRTWPCNEPAVALAENVPASGGSSGTASVVTVTHTATFPFTQPPGKPGEYTLSVNVTYISKRAPGTVQAPVLKPQSLGSASVKHKVKPPSGFPHNITLNASPPTNSQVPFPVNVTLSASVNVAADPAVTRWRFVFEAQGCSPNRSNPIDSSYPSASWTTTCATSGQHNLFVYVDKIRISGCVWEAAGMKYDYGYFLRSQ